MFIRAIHLSNFKSFRSEQTVEFGNKNIIVGKNGSGKSNFLQAIASIFLLDKDTKTQYNDNEETTSIRIDIDNSERRFPFGSRFSLSATYRDNRAEYCVNERVVLREELRGLLENAGFSKENIVMQGKISTVSEMSSADRYGFIGRIAGAARYEESKEQALRYLGEGNEEKIVGMLERIDLQTRKTEEFRRKMDEYERLKSKKTELEYELAKWEVKLLNDEIDAIVVADQAGGVEVDDGIIDFEIRECRESICKMRTEADEIQEYLKKHDRSLVEQLESRLRSGGGKEGNSGGGEKENGSNVSHAGGPVNMYSGRVEELHKKKETQMQRYNRLLLDETDAFIQLKARKYFDAMANIPEDLKVLESQYEQKRREIESYKNGNLAKEDTAGLVSERKQLWIKEKMLKNELAGLKDTEKGLSSKILYLGKQSINIYDSIRNESGVFGTVYSLLTVPDEVMDAFEAVTRNSLFWIVVEDDSVATRFVGKIEGRATFVALNIIDGRLNPSASKIVDDDRLIRLSESVRCDRKYKSVVELVCKDFYICTDIKTAIQMSEQYNLNVVTLEGDIVNRKGPITGGYEQTQSVLRELKQCQVKMAKTERRLGVLGGQIGEMDERIRLSSCAGDQGDGRILENLRAVERYLEWKIAACKNKVRGIHIKDADVLENEYKYISEAIPELKLELEVIDNDLLKYSSKKERIDLLIDKIAGYDRLNDQIACLRDREKSLVDQSYARNGSDRGDMHTEAQRQKKHILIGKRTNLTKKMGISDFKNIDLKQSRDVLVEDLKAVNGQMKKYYGFDKKELCVDPRADLKDQLEGLRSSKTRILEFVDALDKKKEETLQLTFSMVSTNYSYYYRLVTGLSSELVLGGGTVDISVGGSVVDVSSLSGGQKTVVALCLIFAIQKNDPSPFYVFDEMDANLDGNCRLRVYDLIRQENAQYFITSFKEECLACGDRFFGVAVDNKASFVGEIDAALAAETIKH